MLKKNLVDKWWRDFVECRPDCFPIDTPVICSPQGFTAMLTPLRLIADIFVLHVAFVQFGKPQVTSTNFAILWYNAALAIDTTGSHNLPILRTHSNTQFCTCFDRVLGWTNCPDVKT